MSSPNPRCLIPLAVALLAGGSPAQTPDAPDFRPGASTPSQRTERVENLRTGETFMALQAALDAAEPGDELVAQPGVYRESIVIDKDVLLRSVDPNDPDIVDATRIRGVGPYVRPNVEAEIEAVCISAGTLRGFVIRPDLPDFQRGVIASGTALVTHCVIRDFRSLRSVPVDLSGSAVFRRNRVVDNYAYWFTAYPVSVRQSAVLVDNLIENNICAFMLKLRGSAVARRNTLRRNSCDNTSIAVSLQDASVFDGNLVYDNSAPGARFQIRGSGTVRILNNTIVHSFGAMIHADAEVVVRGNIVVSQSLEGPDSGWFGLTGNNQNADYNCLFLAAYGNDPSLLYTDGITPGPHDVLLDPRLLESEDGLRLGPDSPCINNGDPDYVAAPGARDIFGQPRVSGGRIDIGAAERQICGVACDVSGGDSDLNDDCRVDLTDLAIILAAFGTDEPDTQVADTNSDGVVDMLDLSNVLERFGVRCAEGE